MKKFMLYAAVALTVSSFVGCSSDEAPYIEREDIVLTTSSRAGVNDFNRSGFELFEIARQDENYRDCNFVFSPLSVSATLAMMANGANGETLKEITDFLAQESTIDEINELCGQLLPALKKVDPQCDVSIINSLWYQNGMLPHEDFITKMQKYYGANLTGVDFENDRQNAIDSINAWVEKTTNGNIKNLIENLPTDYTYYVFANSMYFKGPWQEEFTKFDYDAEFIKNDGSKVITPFMKEELFISFSDFENCSMVEIPYGNNAFEMMIFVPDEGVSMDELAQWLTPERYSNLKNEASYHGVDYVTVEMPKFTINQGKHDMIPWLNKAGINKAFTKGVADFTRLSNKQQEITLFLQSTKIEVDEKGAKAVESTAGAIGDLTANLATYRYLKVNRPFIFMIREVSTGALLFLGQVTDPSIR